MRRQIKTQIFTLSSAFVILASTAFADDKAKSYPSISVEIPFEIQNDFAYESDDTTAEFNNLNATIEPAIGIHFTKAFSVNSELAFEQVQDQAFPGDDQFFDNQGLFVKVLTVNYDTENFSVFGGKFGPNFGIAWDVAPGVFGTDLAEEYELSENLGFGGAWRFKTTEAGTHSILASTFFTDTSGFAESAFTRRSKTREGSGGPGNTGDLASFAVAIDGGEYPSLPGFRYHIGYTHLGNETANASDEGRFAIGAEYAVEINKDLTLTPLVEYVNFSDADGTNGQDRFYLTTALGAAYQNWNLGLAYTRKETDDDNAGTFTNEEQFSVSGGYAFNSGFGIDVGWKTARNAGVDTDTFGTLLSYTLKF